MKIKISPALLLFLSVAAFLLLFNLGQTPLFEPDEGRYGEMALRMFQTGDWAVPYQNGIPHLHKPPLGLWFINLSYKLFGISEFSTRFPGALFSFFILCGVLYLGRYLFDFKSGLWSAWVLLTSSLYLVVSRLVTLDIYLTFFTFFAVFSFAKLFWGTRYPVFFFYLLVTALGLAMFAKGPVGWMIAFLPAFFFAVWKRKSLNIPFWHWVFGVLIFFVLSFGWYLYICYKLPGALDYFLVKQLASRIGKGAGHMKDFYYFLIVLPVSFLPWTVFLPQACAAVFKRNPEDLEKREKIQFLFLWFLIPFLGFTFFKSKLATYIVPLFPPLALLVGRFLADVLEGGNVPGKAVKIGLGIAVFIPLAVLIGGLVVMAVKPILILGIPSQVILLAEIFMVLVFVLMVWNFRRVRVKRLLYLLLLTYCGLGVLGFWGLPSLQLRSIKPFAQKILENRKPGDLVFMYNRNFASLPFYLGERIPRICIEADLTFAKSSDLERYFIEDCKALKPKLETDQRVFVMSDTAGYEKARQLTSRPLYVILKQQKSILFSNRS